MQDYSKAWELLSEDSEEKAQKYVHDNLYNKGYRAGYKDASDKIDRLKDILECCLYEDDPNADARMRADWAAYNKGIMIAIKLADGILKKRER